MDVLLLSLYKFFLLIIAFLFGSFTNVLIYRIPRQESLLKPRSHCPECKYQLKWYENIPVLSYIFLRAKCSNCHTHIPSQYLIVEIIVGLLGTCFIDKIHHLAEYLFIMIVISAVVAMAFIDHKHHKLPHVLSYSTLIIALAYIGFYGSPYYMPLEGFLGLPKALANLFSALSFFGLTIFSLDCFTHIMNLIYFREKALRVTPNALCFRNRFLTKYVTYLYLVLVSLEIYLAYSFPLKGFVVFNLVLGISYFINEICLEYLFNKESSDIRDAEDHQTSTVFGGGDTVLVSLIAIILGPVNALIVLLAAFYIALIYCVILKISTVFDKKIQTKSSKYIPLGGALAIAFIAAMIIL